MRILYLEDVEADAVKVDQELRKGGLSFHFQRVDTRAAFLRELEQSPDVILSDHGVPEFDGLTALGIARKKCPDVPFIFVTNALSREMEIEKLTGGVTDYVRKSQLDYLPVAVRHALREAEEWRSQRERLDDFRPRLPEAALLPICSSCKKIRDDQSQWIMPEIFFRELLKVDFTHSICPDCAPKMFGEVMPRRVREQTR